MSKQTDINKFVSIRRSDIENKVNIAITGDIGWDFDGGSLISYLRMWHDNEEEIEIDLFSFGGSVFHALAVYDFVKSVGYKITANLYGMCGSAATIISCACETVNIGANSFFLVHGPYYGEDGSKDEQTEKIKARMIEIYKAKTGLNKRDITKLLDEGDNGAILGAKEAKDLGFVDNILKEARNAVAAFLDRVQGPNNPQKPTQMDFTNLVNRLFGTNAQTDEEARNVLNQFQGQAGNQEAAAAPETTGTAEEAGQGAQAAATTEASAQQPAVATTEASAQQPDYGAAFDAVEARLSQIANQVQQLTGVVADLAQETAAAAQASAQEREQQDQFTSQLEAIRQNVQNLQAFRSPTAQPAAPAVQVQQAQAAAAQANTRQTGTVIESAAAGNFLNAYLGKAKAKQN